MPSIRPIEWKMFEKFLSFVGCTLAREKGDYRIWQRKGMKRPIVIPKIKAIPVFIIRNNIHLLGISPEDYISIIEKEL